MEYQKIDFTDGIKDEDQNLSFFTTDQVEVFEIFKQHILSYNNLSETNKTRLNLRIYHEMDFEYRLWSIDNSSDLRLKFFQQSKKIIKDNIIPDEICKSDKISIIDEILKENPNLSFFTTDFEVFDLGDAVF